jgi:hypothetical protein
MASKAMKKAWDIFKKAGIRTKEAWSNALRQAWAIVKGVMSETILPTLKGTEKQVKWAEDIRKKVVPVLQAAGEKYAQMAKDGQIKGTEEKRTARAKEVAEAIEKVIKIDDAGEWINAFGTKNMKDDADILYSFEDIADLQQRTGVSFHKAIVSSLY